MNFLAHFVLSHPNKPLSVGNFLGDFVKGKAYENYPPAVKNGILLHRFIDSFTDEHALVKEVTAVFKPEFGRYSAIITDVAFDYILAKYFTSLTPWQLDAFAESQYENLAENQALLTPGAAHTFTYMRKQNWLYYYKDLDGVATALKGISNRLNHGVNLSLATPVLEKNETLVKAKFEAFFPILTQSCTSFLERGSVTF
ncbi:MAG: acyl carrier protein phosphodiesterase [Luteibaculaceae bacterium]